MKKTSGKKAKHTAYNDESTVGSNGFTLNDLLAIKSGIMGVLDQISDSIDYDLSTVERLRKKGSGIRRYGFIDKTSDIALDNSQFAPQMFSASELKDLVRKIEELRNILLAANQFSRSINDLLLITGDEAFQLALMYYNSVRELARRRVAGAEATFRTLQPFFARGRRHDQEPTEPEVERDVKALLKGKKDGRIVIENEKPQLTGGKHIVVDEVAGGHAQEKMRVTE